MPCKVLVCDDDPDLAAVWMAEIKKVTATADYDLLPVPSADALADAFADLLQRRARVRAGQPHGGEGGLFDDADIVIIDYDLIHIEDSGTRHTGEGIARLARAFSTCGIIVILNQFPEAQFDLSLRGHVASHGDLNLDADLVARPGLWTNGPWNDFRPWQWPVLSNAAERLRKRAAKLAVDGALDQPILATLGLSPDDAVRISDTAFGFIAASAPDADALAAHTFRQFLVANSSAADPKDAECLLAVDPGACARIAAARVAKWLERDLLAPQDVLVDAPHALQRFPFLMRPEHLGDLDAWNAVAAGDLTPLRDDLVPNEAWFAMKDWLGCPTLYWRRLDQAQSLGALRMEFDYSDVPDFVFLEDASRFAARDGAVEFRAGFHNEYDRRYAKRYEGIKYAPQRRFAFVD